MIVARRYAKALYEEAVHTSKTDVVDEDMRLIRRSLDDSRELGNFFASPLISREKKESVVRELFEGRVDRLTLTFLTLLVKKQREDLLPSIVSAYVSMRDEQLNVAEARVRTAEPLDEAAEKKLATALGAMTGKTVRLKVVEDKSLIGGVVIRIGDTVYDGSVQHQLERLRERMEVGSYLLN